MSSALPLRFLHHLTDPVLLICEGSDRPSVGERVRAIGSEGNGLMVVAVVDELPQGFDQAAERFGLQLKRNEIPWPPNTLIEVVRG
jgi:hypothetical protein